MPQSYTADQPKVLCEEETPHNNSHMTSRRQLNLSNQHSFPHRDDCKTKKDTKYCTTKQGPYIKPQQKRGATINNESATTEPPL